jgi:signal transduction histidine kinase
LSAPTSIGRQLIWRLSALFLLSLLLSAAIFLYEAWVNRIDTLDRSLRGAAAQLAATIERGPGAGQLRIPDAAATGLAPVELPSLRYAVIDRGSGALADGSSTSLAQELGADAGGRPEGGFDFRDADGRIDRGYVMRVPGKDAALTFLVSSATLSLADTIAWMQDETLSELVPVLAPLFIGTLLLAPFTIRRALRPLARLSAEAALIEPSRTDVRLQETGVPSEILPLVRAINTALQRIDEGFELQRRFTTNAAHELRTPLAILRARIDGLEDGEAKDGLSRDVERMTRLVSQLLTAGRLEMQPPALDGVVDLAAMARETVERLAILPAAREHELKLRVPEQPVTIRGEEEALGDALRNLIDNALAHSPAGAPVEIAVAEDGSLEVRDHGPGIPPAHREQIFERFWRARKSGGEGAGLGLSIVRAIVKGHRGSISVADNPGGGTVFRLAFPLSRHV